ncbi:hypothetical protein [Campylobacter mucosalis]|uniref:hypothetical protein n=1 Tax=Campylobacter mucosalis TaxID=202 RepID=UPI0014701125|nr:hypothetical protein [Campylobacter mucosalis]
MFLENFDDYKKENFLQLLAVVGVSRENLEELAKQINFKSDVAKILETADDINTFFDDEIDEFKSEILDLIDDMDIKFYLEVNMYLKYYDEKHLFIKKLMKDELNASDEVLELCDSWSLNMANYYALLKQQIQ